MMSTPMALILVSDREEKGSREVCLSRETKERRGEGRWTGEVIVVLPHLSFSPTRLFQSIISLNQHRCITRGGSIPREVYNCSRAQLKTGECFVAREGVAGGSGVEVEVIHTITITITRGRGRGREEAGEKPGSNITYEVRGVKETL
jgi:hypothetical protein